MQNVKTILADEQCIFLEGLKTVLSQHPSIRFELLDTARNGRRLEQLLGQHQTDLLILDLNLPEVDGLQVLKSLHLQRRQPYVLVLSRYDSPKVIKSAFRAGVHGYVLKDKGVKELYKGIREVLNGQTYIGEGVDLNGYAREVTNGYQYPNAFEERFVGQYHLTKREMQILRLIAEALSNKEIAQRLFISDQTVSVHRKNIMRKLGVSNTAGLIKTAYENCLV